MNQEQSRASHRMDAIEIDNIQTKGNVPEAIVKSGSRPNRDFFKHSYNPVISPRGISVQFQSSYSLDLYQVREGARSPCLPQHCPIGVIMMDGVISRSSFFAKRVIPILLSHQRNDFSKERTHKSASAAQCLRADLRPGTEKQQITDYNW